MQINTIAYRDIKLGNIMQLNENKYVIADYGEGESLSYYKTFSQNCFY